MPGAASLSPGSHPKKMTARKRSQPPIMQRPYRAHFVGACTPRAPPWANISRPYRAHAPSHGFGHTSTPSSAPMSGSTRWPGTATLHGKSVQSLVIGDQYSVSSDRMLLSPVTRILHPASCILHPASRIPHPASRILHPASLLSAAQKLAFACVIATPLTHTKFGVSSADGVR